MAVTGGEPGSQLEMAGPADTAPRVSLLSRAGRNKQHHQSWSVLFWLSSSCTPCFLFRVVTLASQDAVRRVVFGKVMVRGSFLTTVNQLS